MNQDNGIIIRTTKLTETSLIVTFITETHGLIKAVAKGARRPKSPFRGKIDLFFQADICWRTSKNTELHTLTEISNIEYKETLRKKYTSTSLAAYFCKLLETLCEPDIPAEGFHDLLSRALNYLCEQPANMNALNHFEKQACQLLGIYNPYKSSKNQLLSVISHFPKLRQTCISELS